MCRHISVSCAITSHVPLQSFPDRVEALVHVGKMLLWNDKYPAVRVFMLLKYSNIMLKSVQLDATIS